MPVTTRFTFGAMSLGYVPIERFRENIQIARAAMDAGVWFHASQEYGGGGAFMILRHAFDEDPAHRPPLILKIRCDNAEILRFDVEDALSRLGVERIDIAQLCRGQHDKREVVDDFLAEGPMWRVCQELRRAGKVGGFSMEIFATFSGDALRAIQNDLFDSYIFYYSPIERQCDNAVFDAIEQSGAPILALRTLGGGLLNPDRIDELRRREPGHADVRRFDMLAPLFERSGLTSWLEFSAAFLRAVPGVQTTIAGTMQLAHLPALLALADVPPLDPSLVVEIKALHREWFGSAEKAAP